MLIAVDPVDQMYVMQCFKNTEWWDACMVMCLGQDADLHMVQLMPLPLTVSCFSKIQIGSGTGSPR